MMNKKKLLSTICAAALTVSVAGTSIVSAIAADKDAGILKGKVTDIDGDFAPEDKPLPDEDFDPAQKPAFDDTFAPDDQPAAGGQFAPTGQPGQDAPRGGFNGGMMQPDFGVKPDRVTA